ncbi:MAG TPA: formyltransferase family protein [Polyangiaceae bacterium]|nr:formyltransferase family protein [Polyangiaceae bacterium]
MRIVYFGLPVAALLLHGDGVDIDLAVISRADAAGRRRLAKCMGQSRVFTRGDLSQEALHARVRTSAPDLLVSWFWTTKLPLSLVREARLGGIGVHPSLLPRHRGPDPYYAAIDEGDATTGVTVHRIAEGYDTGAILGSRKLAIEPGWTAWQLARRLDRPSLALLRETVALMATGAPIAEQQQDESKASWAPLPSLSDCALRWSWPTDKILRRIRALSPAPGAFTEIHGRVLTILQAERASRFPRALAPGEAAVVGPSAVVRSADGAIELVRGEMGGEMLDVEGLASVVARGQEMMIG